MANGPGRGFLTGALLVVFILLTLSAWRFMTSEESLESFEGFTAGPTRAADCQCLPGYIPSNATEKSEFVLDPRGWGYVLTKGKKYGYWWNMHGMTFNWSNTKHRRVSWEEINRFSDGGQATKPIIEEALRYQKEGAKAGSIYFCQSLSNPAETRKCY
jgi:hypothetical protein